MFDIDKMLEIGGLITCVCSIEDRIQELQEEIFELEMSLGEEEFTHMAIISMPDFTVTLKGQEDLYHACQKRLDAQHKNANKPQKDEEEEY